MARTHAFRKYQLTINNPMEHGHTHDVLRSTISTFSACIYWCMCDEIGEQGTPHTHLFLYFRNAVEFSTIQQRFYGAHIEGARGSCAENRAYIRKDGKWQHDAKHETNLPDTFEESGELPDERTPKQRTSDHVLDMIKSGASDTEILNEHASMMTKLPHISATRQTLLAEQYKDEFRHLDVTYLWGPTGTGKTRGIMEAYGYTNVYRVTNYQHPFDGYCGQPVILFDEFRSSLPLSDMLIYLDGYPTFLPSRYADKVACYSTVYVVSNIPFEKQYPNIQADEPASWEAFKRRFGLIFMGVLSDIGSAFPPEEDTPNNVSTVP